MSAYAFSAGISGILAAGFADRFDRKRLLLFFYVGFTLGTLLCALAQTYHVLLLGRIVTGLFGGVIGSIVLAIVTDLFPLHLRGRVMGFVQTAFAASQVLGIPAGLFLVQSLELACLLRCDHRPVDRRRSPSSPSLMQPVDAHLKLKQDKNAFRHLIATVGQPRYTLAFAVTTLLATGGYMLMPFGSAFTVQQSRHRHRASADDLSGLRPVQHLHRTAGRPRQRRLRQISDLRVRQRDVRSSWC